MAENKEIKYDGVPSVILKHRPFFSIVVPCYNCRSTIKRLMESFLDQEMEDDMEIILADDCSTEDYQDIIEPYLPVLSIRRVRTAKNGGPGDARELGVSAAEGVWLCFADSDDQFIENSLSQVKKTLLETGEQYYAIADFIEYDPVHNIQVRQLIESRNWCHGKFYNIKNLWVAGNIHFVPGLLTHEDIAISTQVDCFMNRIKREPLHINTFVYLWMITEGSITRKIYGERTFLETFYGDYIASTGEVYINKYLETEDMNLEFVIQVIIETILFAYFYMQGFIFRNPEGYDKNNEQIARNFLVKCKKVFHITNRVILMCASEDNALLYNAIRANAEIGVGRFMEMESFSNWLNRLHEDIEDSNNFLNLLESKAKK